MTHKLSLFRGLLPLVALLFMLPTVMWGETIYSEGFGDNTSGSNQDWTKATSYYSSTTAGLVTQSGWKVSKTDSKPCSVEGSSAKSNTYSGAENAYIIFTFGDLTDYSNLNISFNWFNNAAKNSARTISIQISSDGGTSWGSDIHGTQTTQDWFTFSHNITAAEAANFAIKVTNSGRNTSYLDDVLLVGTSNGGAGGGNTPQPTVLSVPSNLQSSSVTATGATLSWNAVANASSYTVKIGETEYSNVTTNSYTATGLTAETQYSWTVKAVGDGTNYTTSAYASTQNFTTLAEQGGGQGGDNPSGDADAANLPLSFSAYQESSDWIFNAEWSSSSLTSTSAYYKLMKDKTISSPNMTFGESSFVRFTINMRTTGGVSGNSDKLDIYFNATLLGTIQATSNSLADYTLNITGTNIPSGEGVLSFKSETTDGAKGIGVRSISVVAISEPLLEFDNAVSLDYNTTNGEIAYSIVNPDGSTLRAGVNVEATWISNINVVTADNKVTFDAAVNNTGVKRNATITLTYGTIQKEVTINQDRQRFDYTSLPFNVAAGTSSAELQDMDGVSCKIDGTEYKNETHKIKFGVNTHYIQIKTNERIGVCAFSFMGAGGAGSSSFKIQESTDATNWTDVESFTITFAAQNEVKSWTSTNSFSADARYVKLAFLKTSGEVNCGLGAFSIAQYVAPAPMHGTLNFAATNNDGYWATFSSTQNVIFDANDVVVYTVAAEGEELVMVNANNNSLSCVTDKSQNSGWVAGYYVQAGVGVLINSIEESVNYYFIDMDPYTSNDLNEIETDPEYNMLYAASVDKATLANHKFYKLAYENSNKENLGFYWGAADGAAFTSREGSAYLAVPANQQLAPRRFLFNMADTATDVEELASSAIDAAATKFFENGQLFIMKNGVIYNAQGQQVR